MDKIEFDEKTKANVVELTRLINNLQTQLRTICQTVIYMNGQNPDEYVLAPDLSGVVKIKKDKKSSKKKKGD